MLCHLRMQFHVRRTALQQQQQNVSVKEALAKEQKRCNAPQHHERKDQPFARSVGGGGQLHARTNRLVNQTSERIARKRTGCITKYTTLHSHATDESRFRRYWYTHMAAGATDQ